MPLGTVHAVQLDPVNATPESAAALEPVVEPTRGPSQALAKATASGSKAPIPVITYRDSDWAPRKDRIESIAGVIAPTTEQPLARTRTFGQPLLGSFGEVTAEMVQKAVAASPRATGPAGAGCRRSTTSGSPGRAGSGSPRADGGGRCSSRRATDGADVETTLDPACRRPPKRPSRTPSSASPGPSSPSTCERRGGRLGQQPDQRVRPRADRSLPAGVDVQGRDELRLPDPRHHDARRDGPVPGDRDRRRARVPQQRGRVDQRQPDLLPGLHRLVQHRLRRALRPPRRRRPHRPPPRPSASAPAGPTSWASAAPSRAACRARRAAPTPRRRRSVRAGSRSPRCAGGHGRQRRAAAPSCRPCSSRPAAGHRPTPLDGGAVAQLRSMMLGGVVGHRHRAARNSRRARARKDRARPSTAPTPTPAARWFTGYQRDSRSRCSSRRARAGAPWRLPSPRSSSPTSPATERSPRTAEGPARQPDGAFARTRGTRVRWGGPGRPADPWGPG